MVMLHDTLNKWPNAVTCSSHDTLNKWPNAVTCSSHDTLNKWPQEHAPVSVSEITPWKSKCCIHMCQLVLAWSWSNESVCVCVCDKFPHLYFSADFLVYLLVCLQIRYFTRNPIHRGTPDQTNGAISNYFKFDYWIDYFKVNVYIVT